jgi:hypothetical protein
MLSARFSRPILSKRHCSTRSSATALAILRINQPRRWRRNILFRRSAQAGTFTGFRRLPAGHLCGVPQRSGAAQFAKRLFGGAGSPLESKSALAGCFSSLELDRRR